MKTKPYLPCGAFTWILILKLGFFSQFSAQAIDDYPFKNSNPYNSGNPSDPSTIDPWNFYNRQCTSFVAWRLNGRTTRPFAFHNQTPAPVRQDDGGPQDRWSNAEYWDGHARALGLTVNSTPAQGAVAHWNVGEGGVRSGGHVAWVESVNNNGTVTIEEYNYQTPNGYSRRTLAVSTVGRFIHFTAPPSSKAPVVETRSATSITAASAILRARVTDNGGSEIVECRFEWAKTSGQWGTGTSGVDYGVINNGSITRSGNDFQATLPGLQPNTAYKYRAYAKNAAGWSEANQVNIETFTTERSPSGRVSLIYAGHEIHDGIGGGSGNEDGVINPGEEIDLEIDLRNEGSAEARNVTGYLSSTSPYVTEINDDRENFGTIAPGAVVRTGSDYDFTVSATTPPGQVLQFTLRIEYDGGSVTREFTLTVGPRLPHPALQMEVQGALVPIRSGQTTVSVEDNTDFGVLTLGNGTLQKAFYIHNRAREILRLNGDTPVRLEGSASFFVSEQPNSGVASGQSTLFLVAFEPKTAGLHTATVRIQSNDPQVPEYTFVVQGEGKTRNSPVAITSEPGDQTVRAGGEVTFSVTATGESLSYQWQFNGSPLPGATAATLTLRQVSLAQAGSYAVRVTGADNAVISRAARLTVLPVFPDAGITAGDLDGDGQPDLLFQNNTGYIAAWMLEKENRKSSTYLSPSPVGRDGWNLAGSADFNRDGSSDLFFQHRDGRLGIWLRKEGSSAATETLASHPGRDWRAASLADLNQDGHVDLVFEHAEGTLAVWLMRGTVPASATYLTPRHPGPNWRLMGTGDLDGDAQTDLVFQHQDGTLGIWFLHGTTLSRAALTKPTHPGKQWRLAAVADFDRNGMADLLFQHENGELAFWSMEGSAATLSRWLNPRQPGGTWRVVGPK